MYDANLKRQLQLTTEDIRFIDNVVKMVNDESNGAKAESVFHGTGTDHVLIQRSTVLLTPL